MGASASSSPHHPVPKQGCRVPGAGMMPRDLPQCHHPLARCFPPGLPFSGPILPGQT